MSYEKFMTTNFIEKTKEFPDEHLYDGRLTCDRHLKNQVSSPLLSFFKEVPSGLRDFLLVC